MPTLYVANASKQRHDFIYRIPEEVGVRRQAIDPGSQIVVYQPNAGAPTIKAIIDQHRNYGLTDVAEIDRRRPFVGLCYQLDKPIKVEKIMYADEHNSEVLTGLSQEARQAAAAALHGSISKEVEKATGGVGRLEALEVELVEQNGSDEPGLNEVMSVSQDQQPRQAKRGRPRKN